MITNRPGTTTSAASCEWTATEALAHLHAGDISAEQYCANAIQACAARKWVNALTWFDPAGVLETARNVDVARSRGTPMGPLAGLPVVVKDNIDTVGFASTAGTPALVNNLPAANAPMVDALLSAGAVMFGKTNMHELAKGGTNNNATWGATRNPWDPARIPGGSSGGTAAAIAARLVPAGLGTDTLGSTRIPAAMCGIAALRPSLVPGSIYQGRGIVPDVPLLDTAGPMGRTMADVSLMHTVMTGKTVPTRSLAGVRLGIPSQHYWEHLDPEVHRVARDALDRLRDAGAVLVDVDVRPILDGHGVYFTMCNVPAEFGQWLATRLPSVSLSHVIDTMRAEPVKEWWLGSQPSAESIRVSLARRDALISAYTALFRRCNIAALAYPTCITPAFPIREEGDAATDGIDVAGNMIRESLVTIRNTGATAVFKAPGISLPAGVSSAGLPVGLDLDGLTGGDEALLALGVSVERVLGSLPSPIGGQASEASSRSLRGR